MFLCHCRASGDGLEGEVTWVGAGAGVCAGARADVQVFGSVQSMVPYMQEVLEHSMQCFMLSFSITICSQAFSSFFF